MGLDNLKGVYKGIQKGFYRVLSEFYGAILGGSWDFASTVISTLTGVRSD